MTPAQLLYGAILLVCMWGAMGLQFYRHQYDHGVLYWAYSVMIFCIGWELIDCVKYGAPGFPAQRWFFFATFAVVSGLGTRREIKQRQEIDAQRRTGTFDHSEGR